LRRHRHRAIPRGVVSSSDGVSCRHGRATVVTPRPRRGESEGTLYVEATDDVFVTEGAVVDTLDVGYWWSEARPGDRPRHLRLRMDGRLEESSGEERKVEAVIAPGIRRFALPGRRLMGLDEWEVSYEDTDDGRTHAARLSTGPHEAPPPRFSAPDGACVAEHGTLQPVHSASETARALAP
jgi:hypothetical protein